jgi:cobalt-precorrin 5A hydrolase/precorrin-3B C17-methyltransferase
VLAVAEDGSAVVPLLGGLGGVNVMAREIAEALGVAAITTSGELRFGTCLLNPPQGYAWRTWSKASVCLRPAGR